MKTLITVTLFILLTWSCQKPETVQPDQGSLKSAYTLDGYATYADSVSTPLAGIYIQLWNHTTQTFVGSTWTESNGYYEFYSKPAGFYYFVIYCYLPWKGVNATDAINIELHAIGTKIVSGMKLKAGDVDGNGQVNATDALWVKYRITGMIDYFPVGNWIFEDKIYTVPMPTDSSGNLRGICSGDIYTNIYN